MRSKNKLIECGLALSVLLSTTTCVITVVKMLSPNQVLTTMMMHTIVDESTENAKPHSICFFYHNMKFKENDT